MTPGDNINYEKVYEGPLKELEEMGYSDRASNLEALKATKGNIFEAIPILAERQN